MRRLIAIVMLVLLPLQALWAAAAPYCQHESGTASHHLGHHAHHAHRHAQDHGPGDGHGHAVQPSPSGDSQAGTPASHQAQAQFDHDHHCQAPVPMPSAAPALPGGAPPSQRCLASPPAGFHSHDAHQIERPKWPAPPLARRTASLPT